MMYTETQLNRQNSEAIFPQFNFSNYAIKRNLNFVMYLLEYKIITK